MEEPQQHASILSGAELFCFADSDIADRIGHLRYYFGFQRLVWAMEGWVRLAEEKVSLDGPRSRLRSA